MNQSEKLAKRFSELQEEITKVPIHVSKDGVRYTDNYEMVHQWASGAMQLVAMVFGEASPHYRNLSAAYRALHVASNLETMRGIFQAAKTDYDGGYLSRLETTISGEVFGDFVVAAKQALAEGQKDVAAVLACAALEDALKRFARLNGLDVKDKVMQEVVNALKGKALVSGLHKTLLDTMPKIRDAAMHAEWTKLTREEVGSVVGFVEQFLLTHFS